MAARALKRQAKKCGSRGSDSVSHTFHPPFLGHRSTFVRHSVEALKCCPKLCFNRGIRAQVACNLIDDELVVGHICVEGTYDPVAEWPRR